MGRSTTPVGIAEAPHAAHWVTGYGQKLGRFGVFIAVAYIMNPFTGPTVVYSGIDIAVLVY